MLNSKLKTQRVAEQGNAVIAGLVVLVLVAVGAVAYLTTKDKATDGDAATAPATQTAAVAPDAAAANQAPQIEIKPGNPVVAKLGGKEIKRLDVFNYIQGLGPNAPKLPIDQLFPLALDQVINTQIIIGKVKTANLDNDPAVKAEMKVAKEQIVRKVFMEQAIAKGTTDARLKEAYDLYVKNFPEIPEVKSRHILVKEKDLAKNLIKQLADGGDFVALAKEHSVDATKENGGELGYISKQDQVIPEYIEAVFSQKTGEVSSKAVKSEFGFHIIEVLEERMRPAATYEQAKPFLASQIRNAVLNDVVQKWRNDAKADIFDINGDAIEPAAGNEEPAKAPE